MDDKRKIVEMLAEQKISSEEAIKLLEALAHKSSTTVTRGKFLKIEVTNDAKKKPVVKISIPLAVMKLGMKFIPKEKHFNLNINDSNFNLSELDWDEILKAASKGEIGDLFTADIEEENGSTTSVKIFIT